MSEVHLVVEMEDESKPMPVRVAELPYDAQQFGEECKYVANQVVELLIAKNMAYGDSALNPIRIFSRASAEEQLLVRIDDKLSRLKRGSAAGEDVVMDLLGYLVLLRVQQRRGMCAAESDPG